MSPSNSCRSKGRASVRGCRTQGVRRTSEFNWSPPLHSGSSEPVKPAGAWRVGRHPRKQTVASPCAYEFLKT